MSEKFDPNGVGIANGNIFGFPVALEEANFVITPIPWDATASYGKGTSSGPKAILDASTQLDFYHPELPNAHQIKVFMSEISVEWKKINDDLCIRGMDYIRFLEDGGDIETSIEFQSLIEEVRLAQSALRNNLKDKCIALFNEKKTPIVLGGEHSTPLGLIDAIDTLNVPFGILQIDAHADLRNAYEGFEQSHASIMYNVINQTKNLEKLVQVGIRDIAQSEVEFISKNSDKVRTFYDWDIKRRLFEGSTWSAIVQDIIQALPQKVYISFDIDGLRPNLCPNTGTPVAGGFELEEITYLFFEIVKAGKEIIAFDLNEVSPGASDDWDANVGARALWNLLCATEKSRIKHLQV